MNGHASPSGDERNHHVANGDQSDSDLSDVEAVDRPATESPGASSPAEKPVLTFEEASDSSDNDASDDGDFNTAESPTSARSKPSQGDRASSTESRPAPKRKAAHAAEEDFMRENPELYGLRRSVG